MRRPEEEAERWLAQARDDLRFAVWLLNEDRFFDKGCFIAQQAAEKAAKAGLYGQGARTVLGHSVLQLIDRLSSSFLDMAPLRDAARLLDRFYIPTRYPNGLPGGAPYDHFVRQDLEQAVAHAEKIVSAVIELLMRE